MASSFVGVVTEPLQCDLLYEVEEGLVIGFWVYCTCEIHYPCQIPFQEPENKGVQFLITKGPPPPPLPHVWIMACNHGVWISEVLD